MMDRASTSQDEILVVDDTEVNLQLLSGILSNAGYKVRPASDGETALRIAKAKPPMNGREQANQLQSLYPDLKCMFMSGYTANAISPHSVLDEAVHFIQKPFSKRDLAKKVRSTLENRQ